MGLELSLKFQEKVEPSVGGRPSRVYYLTKRETMILVSGYSVVLRARIVDRSQELEGELEQRPVFCRDVFVSLRW